MRNSSTYNIISRPYDFDSFVFNVGLNFESKWREMRLFSASALIGMIK